MRIRRYSGAWYLIGYEFFGALSIKQCIALSLLDLDILDNIDELRTIFSNRKDILSYFGI